MERDRWTGRFIETSTGLVEFRPRLSTLPARSPLSGAWLFVWENSFGAKRHFAEVERVPGGVRVAVDGGSSVTVETIRFPTHPRGWDLAYACRWCSRPVKHLYVPGVACRRCSSLRFACEGGWRRRLEKKMRGFLGARVRCPFKIWTEVRIPPAGLDA